MRARALLALALCALLAGCGSSPGTGDTGTDWARRYIDPRSDLVVAINLDAGSAAFEQLRDFYPNVKPLIVNENGIAPVNLEDAASYAARRASVDYDDDIVPALRGPLVIGMRSDTDEYSLAYRTSNPEAVAKLVRKTTGLEVVVDGDVVSTRPAGPLAAASLMPARSDALGRLRASGRAVENLVPQAAGLVSAEGGPYMRTLEATLNLGEDEATIKGRADYSADLSEVPESPTEYDVRAVFAPNDFGGAIALFPRANFDFSVRRGDLIIEGEIPYGEVERTGSILDVFR